MNENALEYISNNPTKLCMMIVLVGVTLFGQEIKKGFINENTVKFVLDSYNIENAQFPDKAVYDSKVGALK